MKIKLIPFATLLFLFFTTHANSNPVNKINFIGLNNNSESTLLKLMPFNVGENFSPEASDKIIDSLFKTGFFNNINIVKKENTLNITLIENPNIKYFDFNLSSNTGFSSWLKGEKLYLTQEALSEYIDNNELSAGNIYTKRKLNDFVKFLESKYSESGY